MEENSRLAEVLVCFFKIIFCPTSWFILKQLDNSPSLFMSDSQLDYIYIYIYIYIYGILILSLFLVL